MVMTKPKTWPEMVEHWAHHILDKWGWGGLGVAAGVAIFVVFIGIKLWRAKI